MMPTTEAAPAGPQAAEKRVFVHRLFTAIAPRYDWFNRLASLNLDRGWRAKAIALGDVRSGMKILDVCTGTGDLALACAARANGSGLVIGADFTDAMLQFAQQKQRRTGRSFGSRHSFWLWARSALRLRSGLSPERESKDSGFRSTGIAREAPRVTWLKADAQRLPFEDARFDRVLIGFSTRNLSDLRQGIREMLRVLKPDGRLIILETSRPAHPLVRAGHRLFLLTVVRGIGWILTGRVWPFTYFAKSVKGFLSPQQVVAFIDTCGGHARHVPLSGGLVSVYVVTK